MMEMAPQRRHFSDKRASLAGRMPSWPRIEAELAEKFDLPPIGVLILGIERLTLVGATRPY